MPEVVSKDHIVSLESYRDHLKEHNPGQKIHVRHRVTMVELSGEDPEDLTTMREQETVQFERMPSVMELLDFMAHRSLRDQIHMICNLLTISGFTQAEIAENLGIAHKTYRNSLLEIRKDFRQRT